MTKIKEQAIELLLDIPDDKVIYVIDILKGLKGIFESENIKRTTKRKRQTAMGILNKYANPDLIPLEKDAWGKAMVEKHAIN